MFDYVILAAAGFAAGLLNSVAGGGTFISFPALIYAGIPPIQANASATVAALPGYISSAWAFRNDMQAEGRLSIKAIFATSAICGVIGALLLIVTPGQTFLWIVPWLLLLATVLFAAGPQFLTWLRSRGKGEIGIVASAIIIAAISVYGGYFNGGLGIMLLAGFSLMGYQNLHGMNGWKNVLSAMLSIVSALTFVLAGLIVWDVALLMAVFSAAGGYIGAQQSRKITNTNYLRIFVTLVGLIMSAVFFLR